MEENTRLEIQSKWINKIPSIAYGTMIIGALLLLFTIFLPFSIATDEYEKELLRHPNWMFIEELNITYKGATNFSLLGYDAIYMVALGKGIEKGIAGTCFVIISLYILFAIFTVVSSIKRKYKKAIVFGVLSFLIFRLIMWDFEARGVIGSGDYDFGVAKVICYVGTAFMVLGAVLRLIYLNQNRKKDNKNILN